MLAFLYYTASIILVTAIVFCQPNLFWDCANDANIFRVHNDFNATDNFIRFLNFTYSFVEVNVDLNYDGNHNLSELMNESKSGSNGSNKNTILIFLLLTSSLFHMVMNRYLGILSLFGNFFCSTDLKRMLALFYTASFILITSYSNSFLSV